MNLDPTMQVNYVETQSQLADILMKGSFTEDGTIFSTCVTSLMRQLPPFAFSVLLFDDESRDMSKREVQGADNVRRVAESRPVSKTASCS